MTGLYVDPTDLRAKAIQIRSLKFTRAPEQSSILPPDQLQSSLTAKANLDANAAALYRFQDNGQREGIRLAETLDSVADAYAQVDAEARAHVEGHGGPPEPVVPKSNTLPDPTPPESMGAPQEVSAGFSLIEDTEAKFGAGDGGASLGLAGEAWVANGTNLRAAATEMSAPIQNWEGDAAQQAYQKFHEFADWLLELATAWDQLAGEAFELAAAHKRERPAHTEIYTQYKELEAQMQAAVQNGGGLAHQLGEKMMDLQQRSDELRETYANESRSNVIQPPERPTSNVPTSAVTTNGVKPADGQAAASGSGSGGSGRDSGSGGSGQSPASDPGTAQTSLMSADPSQESKGSESGGSESGSGGGSPSGGESGGGGGLPSLPTGDDPATGFPEDDPRLSPAADIGAGGGGSGGGGAGGGAGSAPLGPSVSGVAVGPSPTAGGGTTGTAAPAAAASGGMMGGMGGMPMGGGHGAQAGTEKKRTPGLAPDEELYTEDRPHTEGIIGRPERRAGQGKRDST